MCGQTVVKTKCKYGSADSYYLLFTIHGYDSQDLSTYAPFCVIIRDIIAQKGVFSMTDTSENKPSNYICTALLAHVDAGKTTLSEGILYTAGVIRKPGRVDNRDAFLDTNEMERERGITIFSKQAVFTLEDKTVTLLDTPGHVDFSAEMERTLQVLDYAVLVISGADGVQGHTATLWRLLERYQIPVFLFINKMDQQGVEEEPLLREVKEQLSGNCIQFREGEESFYEDIAVCDEMLLDAYLEDGIIEEEQICRLIQERKLFPCYFGSALKLTGVKEFLAGFAKYTRIPKYPGEFGAKVFKIARDEKNNRLTFLKVTGGNLFVKQPVTNNPSAHGEEEVWEEKVNQIRIYSGEHFETADQVQPGVVCAVTGLTKTYSGQGLGAEKASVLPALEPVLTYALELPQGCSANSFLPKLRILEEEEPELKISWDETLQEIQAQLMGEVQIEILRRLIWERFHVDVHFGEGKIVYKETIQNRVEGVGHFEPLRHYAEVHLLLEPGEAGSGIQVSAACSEDKLDRNWQRLACTHLEEREHPGVLMGAALTDVRITLVAGKAHLKHTEGGDFRQATYRAVRQGLMKAESVLLEPYYEYCLEVPNDMVGRAMSDIERFQGSFQAPEQAGQLTVLRGTAPVATLRNYQQEVFSYTKGLGRLNCILKGYFPCHNTEEVLESCNYDPESDVENPTGSVFCSHGAGFVVPWYEVENYMHLPLSAESQEEPGNEAEEWQVQVPPVKEEYFMGEDEVTKILDRANGANRKNDVRNPYKKTQKKVVDAGKGKTAAKKSKERYLLVDGYNIVFAWKELNELAKVNIDAARSKLMDILCNYQGYVKCTLILVFDAYRVKGSIGRMTDYHNIHVVYTKEAETADQYIEKLAHRIGHDYQVTVATSDGLEQLIIRGQGCQLISAREFYEEVRRVEALIQDMI